MKLLLSYHWSPTLFLPIAAVGFSFHENGISDEVMLAEAKLNLDCDRENWEIIRNEENSKVLRRWHADTGVYEFRCSGSYNDITASDFVDAQMDLVFRKKWDPNVEKLELVRKDETTDSELIHWITKFPYPLYPREYVFVRRRYINEKDRCIVIANCAVTDSAKIIPTTENKYVRVETYRSVMVVRAHESFDCKGFDYILSYHDNPESSIPRYAYNWLINYGGPYYLDQVHDAAKELEKQRGQMLVNMMAEKTDAGNSAEISVHKSCSNEDNEKSDIKGKLEKAEPEINSSQSVPNASGKSDSDIHNKTFSNTSPANGNSEFSSFNECLFLD
ncbi:unnamed protein product [Thelazia callipaeda]|uniref:Phosphatidylcholine transfer protein n=1 Tax=Thelazia callipaeda TaxID=103827 RepID=A0A0N5CPF9_THECL|nr:unnamed protein product [Thelazia callipaeda]